MKAKFFKKLHPSWLLVWLAVGLLAGLLLSPLVGFLHPVQGLLIAAALGVVAFRNRSVWVISLLLLAGLAIGVSRGAVLQQQLAGYEPLYGQHVTVYGRIAED